MHVFAILDAVLTVVTQAPHQAIVEIRRCSLSLRERQIHKYDNKLKMFSSSLVATQRDRACVVVVP